MKPDILKGKIKPLEYQFLDLGKLTFPEVFELAQHRDEIVAFYLKPFVPSEVDKYIKDAHYEEVRDIYDNPAFIITFPKYRVNIGIWGIEYRIMRGEEIALSKKFATPDTIQHFVSDCYRLGINMEWL